MARNETVLELFLASPSDTAEERKIVESVIQQVNQMLRSRIGRSIELVKWETHASPGVGIDSQDVINRCIGESYDIFVGIMWCKFGTPTGRCLSGTEEEFNLALNRFERNQHSPHIMFYFKNEFVDPKTLDLNQLSKVREFKEKIGSYNKTLYWEFKESSEFEELFRLHIAGVVQNWKESNPIHEKPQQDRVESLPLELVDDEDEVGFIDVLLEGHEDMQTATESMSRLTDAITALTSEISKRTAEFEGIGQMDDYKKLAESKRIGNRSAENLEDFVKRMKTEVPIFTKRFQSGIRSTSKAVTLVADFNGPNSPELIDLRDSLVTNLETVKVSTKNFLSFRDTIAQLPRLTAKFNRARKLTILEQDKLLNEMNAFNSLLEESIKLIDSVVSESKAG